MNSVLLVDDDIELCELLSHWLTQEGFQVSCCHDTQSAQQQLLKFQPDITILDVMLPDGSGLELLRNLRKNYAQLPILMLSARGEPLDRTLGLELGADDYMAKPCDPRELTARLRALLRRSSTTTTTQEHKKIEIDDLLFIPSRGLVYINEEEISLTVSEGRLLEALLEHPGDIIDKQRLSLHALERKLTLYDRSLDMHVSNLRKKLGPHKDGSARIAVLRGRGYFYSR
ncbi:response regulator transcription factor [Pseudomonas sp. F1_0610]|uniref:response regulator transcription factor n=1 Tax=Pseudomonas sp. F1_0610 TaxID=3114284 RepID=UPI0039C46B85